MKIKGIWVVILLIVQDFHAQVLNPSWSQMIHKSEKAWFGSEEAQSIAEQVLLYQKSNGSWPKNVQMHLPLSEAEKKGHHFPEI